LRKGGSSMSNQPKTRDELVMKALQILLVAIRRLNWRQSVMGQVQELKDVVREIENALGCSRQQLDITQGERES